jgi:hypothetical protein
MGGFVRCFGLLETLLPDEFLQTSLLGFLGTLTPNLDNEKRLQIIPQTYECTTKALERHKTCEGCYEMACHALLVCGPPIGVELDWIKRAANCIFRGIVCFPNEEDAQGLGRCLLSNLFEEDSAKKLFEHAAFHQCEGGCVVVE